MPNALLTPVPGTDPDWMDKHNAQKAQVELGGWNMLFIGDSITSHWKDYGLDTWNSFYVPRNALNLGIGGDKVQNILWRLDRLSIPSINPDPKVAVIMIGTNNVRQGDSAADIAEAIDAIVTLLKQKSPNTSIILMGLLAREEKPYDIYRIKAVTTSGTFSVAGDRAGVYYCDVSSLLVQQNGLPVPGTMTDHVHPAAPGYAMWAANMEPLVQQLMI